MSFTIKNLTICPPARLRDPRADRFFIKHQHRMQRIYTDEIIRVEAQRAYCRLVTVHGEFIVSVSLAGLLRQLPPSNLLRVHRSYAVNLLFVESVGERSLMVGGGEVPVSGGSRKAVVERLRFIR